MPIYEYHCENCGADLEIFQHMTDPALRVCPECAAESLHKVFSPVGIVFKGSGFYSTDSKSSKASTSLAPAVDSKSDQTHGTTPKQPTTEKPSTSPDTATTTSVDKSSSSSTSVDN